MKKLIIIFVLLILVGCATTSTEVNRYAAGQPFEYKEGFQAGCNSGYVAAGHPYYKFNKNVKRYNVDDLYRTGWDDGFNVCKGKYNAIGEAMRRR